MKEMQFKMKINNMKNFIELKYHKNSKQEVVFENLDEIKENDNVVLRLKDGNLTPIFYLNGIDNLFIPYLPIDKEIAIELDGLFYEKYLWAKTLDNDFIYDTFRDSEELRTIGNILPKWNIHEDNAVLFLNEEDKEKYKAQYSNYKLITLQNVYDSIKLRKTMDLLGNIPFITKDKQEQIKDLCLMKKYTNKISIILPKLHTEDITCPYHIENINKVCKELKEQYCIERIELFVSHCFIDINYRMLEENELWSYNKNGLDSTLLIQDFKYIDKITTTNSTGILEVQKNDILEVVDCVEFFDI